VTTTTRPTSETPPPPRPAQRRSITAYGHLLIATLALVALQGFSPPGRVQTVLATALAGWSLVLAFRAAHAPRRRVTVIAALACAATIAAVIRAATDAFDEGSVLAINAALVALGPPAVAVGLLRDLRASGTVRLEAVTGVLALYILIGMFFAFLYGAIDRLEGADFFAGGEAATASSSLYFSFVTLTTVGYGDLVAATDPGRTLAVFEALIGQIYLVTVVSLIVSNLGRPPRR
jgi:hypothetical protein